MERVSIEGGCQCGNADQRAGQESGGVPLQGLPEAIGERLRHEHQTGPGKSIKAGTLDDTSHLEPTAHYWTQRMQPWLTVPAGVKSFRDDG